MQHLETIRDIMKKVAQDTTSAVLSKTIRKISSHVEMIQVCFNKMIGECIMEKIRIAIIGSFQKYYDEIRELIELFTTHGMIITSPYHSKVVDKRTSSGNSGFVIFEADDDSLSDAEIQMDTLRKILIADLVYVYNPKGYVGKTTCYEIGVVISKRRPLFFYAMPDDLPIPISERQVISPQEIADMGKTHKIGFVLPNNLSNKGIATYKSVFGFQKHNLLLCGSMKFYELMKCIKNQMEMNGIDTIIPADEEKIIEQLSVDDMNRFKRQVSSSYLRKIRDKNTSAILVINEEKNGISNYIGANTLVEIGMAFTWGKKIFLLNQIYKPLADELQAWGCEPLNADMTAIIRFFAKYGIAENRDNEQLTMFDSIF